MMRAEVCVHATVDMRDEVRENGRKGARARERERERTKSERERDEE